MANIHTWDGGHGLAGKTHLREDRHPRGDSRVLREIGVAHELVLSGELDGWMDIYHTSQIARA